MTLRTYLLRSICRTDRYRNSDCIAHIKKMTLLELALLLHPLQIILANIQSMKRTIDEIERCRANLGLPAEAEETLTAFHWARELLQPIQELQQLSEEESAALRVCLSRRVTHSFHFSLFNSVSDSFVCSIRLN